MAFDLLWFLLVLTFARSSRYCCLNSRLTVVACVSVAACLAVAAVAVADVGRYVVSFVGLFGRSKLRGWCFHC